MSLHTVNPVATRLELVGKVVKLSPFIIEKSQELPLSRSETIGRSSIPLHQRSQSRM
jgi:hypothetical protein